MMSSKAKLSLTLVFSSSKAGAVALSLLLAQAGSAVAQNDAQPSGWDANHETEAEFAYRSVYERSLRMQQDKDGDTQAVSSRPEQRQRAAAPALPVRNPKAVAQSQPTSIAPPSLAKNKMPERVATKPEPASRARSKTEPVETVASTETGTTGAPDSASLQSDQAEKAQEQTVREPFGALPSNPWFSPILSGANEMLTTQVIGDREPARRLPRRQEPATRGDQYCTNIASAAADARFVWQRQTLLKTEEEVKQRIEDLQAQIAEYKKWLARRKEFTQKARGQVTNIYAKMRPEAAAQQLSVLDDETAAAVITQLKPRIASAVMAEMNAQDAARLTAIISASSKAPKKNRTDTPQDRGT